MYTGYCFGKQTFQRSTLRRRLSKAVLNVEEDILVSKVCQKFPIGDFYFFIATVLHCSREKNIIEEIEIGFLYTYFSIIDHEICYMIV